METENNHLYKYSSKRIKELDTDLWYKINNIELDIPFKEKFFLFENKLLEVPKCECGNIVKFIDMVSGFRKFCSRRCALDSNEVKEKRKETSLSRWGVDNPSKSKKIKEKVKKTNLEKFGVEYPLQNEEIKEKTKNKFIENWGVDNPSKVKEVRDRAKSTMVERFGVEHAMHSDVIKDKLKDKFIENWGVDNPLKIKEVRDKAKSTMVERFGVEHAMLNRSIQEKCKKTNIDKYGVDSPLKNENVRDKIRKTNIDKYGVDIPSKSNIVKEKIINSIIDKYGTLNLLEIDEIKDKIRKTNNEKYGEYHISKSSEYREKYGVSNHPNYIKYINNSISLFSCDCDKNHNFEIHIDNYIKRNENKNPLCTICYPIGDTKSLKEVALYNYMKSIYDGEIIQSYRDGLEIDIYLPELKIGFEFNGLYWHSDNFLNKNYHRDKTIFFEKKGIRIIHIWEDDWDNKNKIIKSQINNWLGFNNKVYARNCKISEISISECRDFLDSNHIQGYVNNKKSIGLYHNDELVSIMTFDNLEGRNKMEDFGWNLSRFCNKTNLNVIGGASKLLKYFITNYKSIRIISYADRNWSNGNLYYKLGFSLLSEGRPDYKYLVNGKRVHKSNYKKSKLSTDKTESDEMISRGFNRIWDCGKLKFEIILK